MSTAQLLDALAEALEERLYSNLPLLTARRLAERLTRNGETAIVWNNYNGTYNVEVI